jgi:hypothetical protein
MQHSRLLMYTGGPLERSSTPFAMLRGRDHEARTRGIAYRLDLEGGGGVDLLRVPADRLRSSVSTLIQNLAPSPAPGPTPMRSTSRWPSRLTPMAT